MDRSLPACAKGPVCHGSQGVLARGAAFRRIHLRLTLRIFRLALLHPWERGQPIGRVLLSNPWQVASRAKRQTSILLFSFCGGCLDTCPVEIIVGPCHDNRDSLISPFQIKQVRGSSLLEAQALCSSIDAITEVGDAIAQATVSAGSEHFMFTCTAGLFATSFRKLEAPKKKSWLFLFPAPGMRCFMLMLGGTCLKVTAKSDKVASPNSR